MMRGFSTVLFTMIALLAGASLTMSCQESFDPQYLISKPRIISVIAEPPEVTVNSITTVYAEFGLEDEIESWTWSSCFIPLPASTGYQCASPELEFELGKDTRMVELFIPEIDTSELPEEAAAFFDDTKDFQFIVRLVVKTKAGEEIESIKRITVDYDAELNINPVFNDLTIDGTSVFGATLPAEQAKYDAVFTFTPDTEHEIIPMLSSDSVQEDDLIRFAFFVTSGTVKYSMTTADYPENFITIGEDKDTGTVPETVDVWVVAYDLRGGSAVYKLLFEKE